MRTQSVREMVLVGRKAKWNVEAQDLQAGLDLMITRWRAMMKVEHRTRSDQKLLEPLLQAKNVALPWSSCGATMTAPPLTHSSTCEPGDANGNLMTCGKVGVPTLDIERSSLFPRY